LTAQLKTAGYSRRNPSPRYTELTALYRSMHREGDVQNNIAPEHTFPGQSVIPQAAQIKQWIEKTGAKTILDYGSGKGLQYETELKKKDGSASWPSVKAYWGTQVQCYDPSYPPFSTLPEGTFDGVICTDVLEHCPEEDMPWIIDEIFSYARKFVFANAACYAAKKTLPNGENAHCTIRPAAWWAELVKVIGDRHPAVAYLFLVQHIVPSPNGPQMQVMALRKDGSRTR